MNLLVILLVTTNLHNILESLFAYGFTLKKCYDFIQDSKYLRTLENYQTMAGLFTLPLFTILAYSIEILASTRCPRLIIFLLIVTNLICLLIYPIIFSWYVKSNYIIGTYLLLYTTCTAFKLISFHHVNHDVRKLVKRTNEAKR